MRFNETSCFLVFCLRIPRSLRDKRERLEQFLRVLDADIKINEYYNDVSFNYESG